MLASINVDALRRREVYVPSVTGLSDEFDIFLNGRFLSQAVTGVQRYAAEIVKAIDRRLAAGEVPPALAGARFTLLTPRITTERLDLDRIAVRAVGTRSGHVWDQVDLAWNARAGVLVSLANSGPVLHARHLIVLHDAQVFRRPEFFSRSYRGLHQTLGRLYARVASLGTVSDFSRRELAAVFRLSPEAVGVFPNGSEHILRTAADESVLDRLGLSPGKYFLAVGTMTANKNLVTAAKAAERLARPDIPLVIVGGGNDKVFGKEHGWANAIMAGRRSDAELAGLYRHASALLFPSLYEGFGIPPMEAMSFGCPVIASTAEAVVETCGDAAVYFDPHDVDALVSRMRDRLADLPPREPMRVREQARVRHFSWHSSAGALLDRLAAIATRR